jgi:hypothetical protein
MQMLHQFQTDLSNALRREVLVFNKSVEMTAKNSITIKPSVKPYFDSNDKLAVHSETTLGAWAAPSTSIKGCVVLINHQERHIANSDSSLKKGGAKACFDGWLRFLLCLC